MQQSCVSSLLNKTQGTTLQVQGKEKCLLACHTTVSNEHRCNEPIMHAGSKQAYRKALQQRSSLLQELRLPYASLCKG